MGAWEYGRFRWKLWKLLRDERRVEKQYRRLIARAQKRGDQQKVRELESEESHMTEIAIDFQVRVARLHSEYLIRKSYRLMVPLPEHNEESKMWDEYKGHVFLSERGINKLRADVRAESRARIEMFLMWVPGIVGILGALLGLVSVLAIRK
jgi:hypothetical protein